MTTAAVAVAIFLVLILAIQARRARRRVRPLDPDAFRRALDAMAPDDDHRSRTADGTDAPAEERSSSVVPWPRPAADGPDERKDDG